MPTYEYICSACGHEFESFQSIKAPPIKVCPVCTKKKVERKISVGAGFIFKGGGFYETDYRNEAYKKAAEADKPPTTDAKSSDAPTDSKSAESKSADSKGEAKSTDARATDAKSSDTKPAEAKADAKPAPKAEPRTASKSPSKSKRKG